MFRYLLEKLHTADKFYDVFIASDAGKKSFDCAYKLFSLPKDNNLFVLYIINSMQDWLFEQLTDDEMNSAYILFQNLENSLKELVLKSIT